MDDAKLKERVWGCMRGPGLPPVVGRATTTAAVAAAVASGAGRAGPVAVSAATAEATASTVAAATSTATTPTVVVSVIVSATVLHTVIARSKVALAASATRLGPERSATENSKLLINCLEVPPLPRACASSLFPALFKKYTRHKPLSR